MMRAAGRLAHLLIRDPAQRSHLKAAAGILLFLVVAISFFARAAATTEQLVISWQPLSLAHIVFSFVVVLICFVMVASTWFVTVRLLGGQFTLGQAWRIYFLSSLPRYVPGMIWGYWGRAYLCEREGVKGSVALISSTVEIILFVGTGLSTGLFYWLRPFDTIWIVALIYLLMAIGLTVMVSIANKDRRSLKMAALTFLSWSLLILVYLVFWIAYGYSVVMLVQAVVPVVDFTQIVRVTSGFALAWLAGFLSVFVPGGLGIREAGVALVLEPVTGSLAAVFIAILARFLNIAADAILFIVSLRKSPRPAVL